MALVNKKFQELITFSRASSGTYVNSSGYITNNDTVTNYVGRSNEFDNALWAKSNSFTQTNLLLQSQTFSSGSWTKQTGTTVTAVLVVAPDGTLTGQQIDWTTTAISQGIFQSGIAVLGSISNTKSIYVRADVAGGTVELADPSNTIGTPAFTLTTSWQRISLTEVQTIGQGGVWLRKTASSPAIIYIWGAQLVQGPVPGDYRATTTAALPVLYPDYNGALRARKLCDIATITGHYTNQGVSLSGVFTFTLYAKAGELTGLFLYFSGPNKGIGFDLITGAILQTLDPDPDSYSAVNVGNGWWRLIITSTSGTIASVQAYLMSGGGLSYTGNGSGVYIADAQLVAGSVVTDYADNTTGAAIYAPRFDYDPVTRAAKGLLMEPQRTNLFTYSASFNTQLPWGATTVVPNVTTSPDGTTTGALWVPVVGAINAYLYRTDQPTSAGTYTVSLYIKSAGLSEIQMGDFGNPTDNYGSAVFNIVTGTIGTQANLAAASIQAAGNGWYRCSITRNITSGTSNQIQIVRQKSGQVGDGVNGVYIWGAQLEVSYFATSYIPTVASQVTRSADVFDGRLFSTWYNQPEGTIFVDGIVAAQNGVTNTTITFGAVLNNNVSRDARFIVGATTVAFNVLGAVDAIYPYKMSGAYKLNDSATSLNGAAATVNTSTVVGVGSALQVFPNANYMHVRRITYYPQRLSNAQLQSITA